MSTYTNRYLEMRKAAKIEHGAVTDTDGWSAFMPPAVAAVLRIGMEYGLETHGGPFGIICGWQIDSEWVARKSDEQLQAEHDAFVADSERRRRESLDRNREDWTRRTAELPYWVRERIETFRDRGGERFELDGWGYELCVAELAVMYHASGGQDNERINTYAEQHGTSGNQHDCAKALARAHGAGQELAGTVSALSPLTGNAFYEETNGE